MNTLGAPPRSTDDHFPRRLTGKLMSLSVALAGISACSENTLPTRRCETTLASDVALDSKGSETVSETSSETSTGKLSEVLETTASISKRAQECYAAFRDSSNWCQQVMDYNSAGGNFCDTVFADEPKKLQDICHKKTADCLGLWKQFTSCLDSLPVDASCKAALRPLGMTHDTDGDGLSDHFELWHTHTNPCEPCSNGNNAPCDADADSDGDGITNKDAQKFSGGCISYVPTEECG